jgi:hypothetical protein
MMRVASTKITQLCEARWENREQTDERAQKRYVSQLLALMGWDMPIPFTPRAGAEYLGAQPFLLRATNGTAVAAYFVGPGVIEPPSVIVERGLDYCPATRVLVTESQALNVQYVLVSDLYRSYLYDAQTDELLLFADSPDIFNEDFVPVLSKEDMEAGALDDVRRPPRSLTARQLREWSEHWINEIARHGSISTDRASLAIDRLIVVRYLSYHDILRRTKWRLEQRFNDVIRQAQSSIPTGIGGELMRLFHDMWFDWRMDVFEPAPDLDRVLELDEIVVPMLQEFALIARGKFSLACVLESFNHGTPDEKLRVRMVPDANEEREHYISKQTMHTIDRARIEVDLLEEGYRSLFHWFDKMVALYGRLDMAFEQQAVREQAVHDDTDLFGWTEHDAHRPQACGDAMAYACAHGFGVYYTTARQLRIARLMLTLHLISRYDQNNHAIVTFPSFREVFMERPRVLPTDRMMNISDLALERRARG